MNKSSGNVLFLILIAVALFAALSYAVTQSTRSGGGNVSKEKMDLAFNEMQSVVVAHRTALQRMFMNGVDINSIDASDPKATFSSANAACTSDACKLYNPNGGGLSWYPFRQLHPDLTDPTGSASFLDSNGPTLGYFSYAKTPTIDFIYIFRVTEAFCNFINTKLGITTPTSTMANTTQAFLYDLKTIHTPSAFGQVQHIDALGSGGQAPHLAGRTEGCLKSSGGTRYDYISLLYAN